MTADAAVSGIREVDPAGKIGIITLETEPPYDRPPLTKALWKGKPEESIWRHTDKQRVEFHFGRSVKKIDLQQKRATDDQQEVYTFEKLLLATGGRPRQLPFGSGQIIYYRTVADYRRLRALAEKHKTFAVIGSGFIGSEIAAALAMNEKKVFMLFRGNGIGERIFPPDLSRFVTDVYRQKGVEVLAGQSPIGLESVGEELLLKMSGGRQIAVSGVIAGVGIEPNVELAQAAGLKVENGIAVNQYLQTENAAVYAAGDVAAFYSSALETRLRVEHEDNANTMGRAAGRNMAGKSEEYEHLPSFYSDMFDLGYEAVGELDARLETFADWKEPFKEGVVYYLRAGRIRGVLLWNVWEQVDAARNLIREQRLFRPSELKGLLPKTN